MSGWSIGQEGGWVSPNMPVLFHYTTKTKLGTVIPLNTLKFQALLFLGLACRLAGVQGVRTVYAPPVCTIVQLFSSCKYSNQHVKAGNGVQLLCLAGQ